MGLLAELFPGKKFKDLSPDEKRDYMKKAKQNEKMEPSSKTGGAAVPGNGNPPPGNNLIPGAGGSPASGVPPVIPPGGSANPPGSKERTGRNLQTAGAGSGDPKKLNVTFDIEKLKKAVPKFLRLFFKAFNNIFKILNFIPRIPFTIEFEDLTPEEEELFQEAAWPGVEAALPNAAKKHPITFLFSAFFLMVLGKLGFKKKEKKEKEDAKSQSAAGG